MTFIGQVQADAPIALWNCQDVPLSTTSTRNNLARDPSCELDATGWAVTAGFTGSLFFSGVRATDQFQAGAASYKATCGTINFPYNARASLFAPASVVSSNAGYMLSGYVRPSRACNMSVDAQYFDSNSNILAYDYGAYKPVSANVWTRLNRLITTVDFTYSVYPAFSMDSLNTGDTCYLDAVLIEQSTSLGSYFDGNTAGGGRWTGTVNKSPSAFDTSMTTLFFTDSSNAYNGSISSTGITLVSDMHGVASSAMQFTSAATAVVPGSVIWDIDYSSSKKWTFEFIARFDSSGGGTVLSTEQWKIATFGSGGIAFMPIASSTGSGPTGVWSNGVWHHYVVTFNGTTLIWYVDGTQVYSTTSFTPFSVAGTANLTFTSGTAASLDEVVFYNYPLSSSRVNAHYIGITESATQYITGLNVTPPFVELQMGQTVTQQLMVAAQFSDNTTTAEDSFATWLSTDSTVATVSSSGLVTAVAPGSASIESRVSGIPAVGLAGVFVSFPPQEIVPPPEIYTADPTYPVFDSDGNLIGTTGEYWEVDPGRLVNGQWVYDSPISLATLAWNITTISGRDGVPQTDVENVRVAQRAGRRWIPKTPDQRVISLAMWVQGTDEAGRMPSDVSLRTKFMDNFNMLKKLFAVWDRQILIRRRVSSSFGIMTQEALAEISSNMDMAPQGQFHGTFSVDLTMADPFWYGPVEKSGLIPVRSPFGSRPYPRLYPMSYGTYGGETGIIILNNNGTHDAKLWVSIRGPVTNPTINDLDSGEFFRLAPDVPIDKSTVITADFTEKSVVLDGTGSRYWWFDRTSNWLRARPGTSRFQFTHEGTERTAYVVWSWQPSYL